MTHLETYPQISLPSESLSLYISLYSGESWTWVLKYRDTLRFWRRSPKRFEMVWKGRYKSRNFFFFVILSSTFSLSIGSQLCKKSQFLLLCSSPNMYCTSIFFSHNVTYIYLTILLESGGRKSSVICDWQYPSNIISDRRRLPT